MNTPNWYDLLKNVDSFPVSGETGRPLTADEVQQLERIAQTAESFSATLNHGVSAIGYLLACTAFNGDTGLSSSEAGGTGWLLQSLGELISGLNEMEREATYKLANCAREARPLTQEV